MTLPAFIRPHFGRVAAYRSARDLAQDGCFLDANENAYGSVLSEIKGVALHRYPDPDARRLREALAAFVRLPIEHVVATGGSNEAIDLCIRLTAGPGDTVLVAEPTFALYRTMAELNGAEIIGVPLAADFSLTADAVLSRVTPQCKIFFCCTPNNPTGTLIPVAVIRDICRQFAGMVVVDEAYVEFSGQPSLAALVPEFPNLVVLRTLAKAWGLAALRVGYVMAAPQIIQLIQQVRKPYPLTGLSIALAVEGVAAVRKMESLVSRIVEQREWLRGALERVGITAYPSSANFLLLPFPQATRFYEHLKATAGMVVRNMSHLIPDTIRVTVGTPEENQRFVHEVEQCLSLRK